MEPKFVSHHHKNSLGCVNRNVPEANCGNAEGTLTQSTLFDPNTLPKSVISITLFDPNTLPKECLYVYNYCTVKIGTLQVNYTSI